MSKILKFTNKYSKSHEKYANIYAKPLNICKRHEQKHVKVKSVHLKNHFQEFSLQRADRSRKNNTGTFQRENFISTFTMRKSRKNDSPP